MIGSAPAKQFEMSNPLSKSFCVCIALAHWKMYLIDQDRTDEFTSRLLMIMNDSFSLCLFDSIHCLATRFVKFEFLNMLKWFSVLISRIHGLAVSMLTSWPLTPHVASDAAVFWHNIKYFHCSIFVYCMQYFYWVSIFRASYFTLLF